jgi:putative hydrolase of the HAD superfamily
MTNYEVALFDVDGVILAPRKKFFSDRLVEEFGVSPDESLSFVKELLIPSMTGKVDLRTEFPILLKKWGINKTIDEIFKFWWTSESEINHPALHLVDELRGSGLKTYLATDQERHRAHYIMEQLGLREHFVGAFISCELGFQKHDESFWRSIVDSLKTDPARILYWDDDQKNVDRAASVGITSRLYSNFEQFQREVKELT